jgi:hypothetical protein
MTELPEFYFRVRENGAAVFRISTGNRQWRIEMTEIAVVNVKNGNVRPHGDHVLTDDERQAIDTWMEERRALLARRDLDDIHRTVERLNLTAHWAQSRASDAELEEVTDSLLLAMHDLRAVLVRKKADRARPADQAGE